MASEAPSRRRPEGDRSDRTVDDPTKLINWGTNRWSFKPEFELFPTLAQMGCGRLRRNWFFTTNHDFWSRNATSGDEVSIAKPDGSLRRTPELRLRAAALDLARW